LLLRSWVLESATAGRPAASLAALRAADCVESAIVYYNYAVSLGAMFKLCCEIVRRIRGRKEELVH
jgi:hypothetical protein